MAYSFVQCFFMLWLCYCGSILLYKGGGVYLICLFIHFRFASLQSYAIRKILTLSVKSSVSNNNIAQISTNPVPNCWNALYYSTWHVCRKLSCEVSGNFFYQIDNVLVVFYIYANGNTTGRFYNLSQLESGTNLVIRLCTLKQVFLAISFHQHFIYI